MNLTDTGKKDIQKIWARIFIGIGLILIFIILYHYLFHVGFSEILLDTSKFKNYVQTLGVFGPLAIIAFMSIAIIMSPIPSAPIAVAAGALFGHSWGTLYIIIGAEIGALTAFTISKLAGYELMKKWFGEKLNIGIFKSQKNLMLIVLFSRLVPFLSFDIISYAAGLTPITFFRFAVATLLGVAPISFVLAHFGSDLGSSDPDKIMMTVFVLGFITLAPIGLTKWFKRKNF